jgi:hypothetical protein
LAGIPESSNRSIPEMRSGDPQGKTGNRILNGKGTSVLLLWQLPKTARNMTDFFGTRARLWLGRICCRFLQLSHASKRGIGFLEANSDLTVSRKSGIKNCPWPILAWPILAVVFALAEQTHTHVEWS